MKTRSASDWTPAPLAPAVSQTKFGRPAAGRLAAVGAAAGSTLQTYSRRRARLSRPHDHSDRQPRDDLRLFQAGRPRRASDDASPARQLRPAVASRDARYRPRAAASALDSRRVRQLRDPGELCWTDATAAGREQHDIGSYAAQWTRVPARGSRPLLSVFLRRGRNAGRRARRRAGSSGSVRGTRPLGSPLRPSGPADRNRRAADDADLCDQGGIFLRTAPGDGHAEPVAELSPGGGARVAILRC